MNERIPPPPPSSLPTASPPRTTPPPFVRPSPPPARSRLHPLAFVGILAGALVLAVALLFVSRGDSDNLTDAEVEALVEAAAPAPAQPTTQWATPTHPAALHLTTNPAGATVLLDGEPVGRTPLRLDALRPAFYAVTLRLPDHLSLDTTLYLASNSTAALDVSMKSLAGAPSEDAMPVEPVPVTQPPAPSPPPSANRVARSGTPSGGGTSAARSAPAPEVRPSFRSASPEAIQRVSHTGSLSVSSSPTGADVLIDGVSHGRAPLSLSGLRPGFYVVTLSLPGRTPVSYRAEVTARDVSVVKAVFPSE